MKYTLSVTQVCNLRCIYCYIRKKHSVMSMQTAERIIEEIFEHTPAGERIDIGFFGGEPLLEFGLIKEIVSAVENHPKFDPAIVEFDIVTNGTLFSEEIAAFMEDHNFIFCISCDGPPHVHDMCRQFKSRQPSSSTVENTIRKALSRIPRVLVNAVYGPQTLRYLPDTVAYLSSLGVNQIYLNPDYSALWEKSNVEQLSGVYERLGEQYMDFHLQGKPHLISLIDSKIMAFLKGGNDPAARCKMGRGEFAFAPSGNIYPCERLIGEDDGQTHCIGNITKEGLSDVRICRNLTQLCTNISCASCSLADYCMNWCGCSNFFSTGVYDRVSPFLCSSERAAISTAFQVFKSLERRMGLNYVEQLFTAAHSASCKDLLLQTSMEPAGLNI